MPPPSRPSRTSPSASFRDWLLSEHATAERLAALAPGLTPEMVAAVSKIMRLQDLVTVAAQMPRGDALPLHHRTARAACRRASSRTIRPTICTASRPA